MKLSEFKTHLKQLQSIAFELPDGSPVPGHFHITEVGKISKHFIDCGGTVRTEEVANFQLWDSYDYDHRLQPEKLLHIIELSEKILALGDLEIEVEYQGETINKYGLDFDGRNFRLTKTKTDCLAKDKCGVPVKKVKRNLSDLCCTPDSGCC